MTLTSKSKWAAAAGVLAASSGGVALAQASAIKAADERKAHFAQLGKTFKGLNGELAKDAPDQPALVAAATTVNKLARKLPHWFPAGSGKEAQPKSAPLPIIWTDSAGFGAAAKKFRTEATKLKQVARSGDIAALRVQYQATGATCGGCHKVYREPKS